MDYLMTNSIHQIITSRSETLFLKVKSIREHIHANPELSYQEFETSKFIHSLRDIHFQPY